jgi:hypothetical protein
MDFTKSLNQVLESVNTMDKVIVNTLNEQTSKEEEEGKKVLQF